MPIYSDREFDHVLKKHADQLVVVCASSTDCAPCRTFEPVFDVSIPCSDSVLLRILGNLMLPSQCMTTLFEQPLLLGSSTCCHCSQSVKIAQQLIVKTHHRGGG